jgi:hypothetical protein
VLLRRLRQLETEELPAAQRREKASAEQAADTSRRLVQAEVGAPGRALLRRPVCSCAPRLRRACRWSCWS